VTDEVLAGAQAARARADRLRKLASRALRWGIVAFFLVISLFPAAYMVLVSLMTTQRLFEARLFPWPLRWENFVEAWVSAKIGILYWNSFYISTTSVILTLLVCAPAGYGLARVDFWGRGLLFNFLLLGLTLPVSTSLLPLFFNLKALGLINTPFALIGPYTGFGISFGVFILKGFFETLPRELEEAARVDGASEFRIFLQVMLPLTRPAVATVSIFLFLTNWNEFILALTFITEPLKRTLPTGIYSLSGQEFYGNYPTLAAALVIFSIPVVVLYFIFQSQFIEGLTAGALKQ
jgi:raffinose/stachyose/melibiose transport system permease protein